MSISAFLAAKYVSGLAGLNVLIVHGAPPNLGLPQSMYCRVVAAEAGQVDRQAGHLHLVLVMLTPGSTLTCFSPLSLLLCGFSGHSFHVWLLVLWVRHFQS